jgi:CDP-diacylglycerol---serine O-phosphatidyltransferase
VSGRGRAYANLSTLANAAVGVGSIVYTLEGNKVWAMLLIVAGLAFDGLDGYLSRKANEPTGSFGRIADSVADAITFGIAPALLIAVHSYDVNLWAPYMAASIAVGVIVAALAFARLIYFTVRAYHLPYFLGAPTPQTALAIILLVLYADQPAFVGTNQWLLLVGALFFGILMVVPIRFPKVRRGSPIRRAMTVTAVALVVAIIPVQFVPDPWSPLWILSFAATLLSTVGVAAYYVWGPFTVPREALDQGGAVHA